MKSPIYAYFKQKKNIFFLDDIFAYGMLDDAIRIFLFFYSNLDRKYVSKLTIISMVSNVSL